MKIALVEPSSGIGGCYTYAGHNEYEPLGLEYIAASIIQHGHDVTILQQGVLSPEEIAIRALGCSPDVIGMSVMTHAARSTASIATLVKRKAPKISVVVGGYHPSGEKEFIRTEGIDYSVIGEGEETFANLLATIEADGDVNLVPGLRFIDNGEMIDTGPAKRITELDKLPFPIRSGEFLSRTKMHGLMSPSPSAQRSVAVMLGGRGCPNSCSFCCSPSLWGRKVIYRTPDNIIAEIDDLVDRFNTNAIFFSDLTFNTSKERINSLCSRFATYQKMPSWYAMCTTTGLDAHALELMHGAGCSKIGFGIESLSQDSLEKIGKHRLFRLEQFHDICAKCDSLGILTKGYLIIGYPWESPSSLKRFLEDIIHLPVDEIRISFFTPFPGSADFKAHESQLLTKDWSKYNAIRDVVVCNENGITPSDLIAYRQEAFRTFYNSTEYQRRVKAKQQQHPKLTLPFEELFGFLREGNVLS